MKNYENDFYKDMCSTWAETSGQALIIMFALKIIGFTENSWLSVFVGVVWVPLVILVLLVLSCCLIFPAIEAKHWLRRRKADRRIIKQAKALNLWDKKPLILGGRALELKAWKDFKIRRQPGETDAQLRRRYTEADDEECTTGQ